MRWNKWHVMLALKDAAKSCHFDHGRLRVQRRLYRVPAGSANQREDQYIWYIHTTAPPRLPSLDTAVHSLGRYFDSRCGRHGTLLELQTALEPLHTPSVNPPGDLKRALTGQGCLKFFFSLAGQHL